MFGVRGTQPTELHGKRAEEQPNLLLTDRPFTLNIESSLREGAHARRFKASVTSDLRRSRISRIACGGIQLST